MTRKRFDQRRFAEVRARLGSPASYRAYEAMLQFLSREDLKRHQEWDLFVRFCEAAERRVNPADVEMLDPPWPDLRADASGHSHYFELGEIVQENWMKVRSQGRRQWIDGEPLPLTAVWSPLESILRKKMKKGYEPKARPLSLLLYWERNAPPWSVIASLLKTREPEIRAHFEGSVFDHLWLFMVDENHVPFSLSRKTVVVPPG